MIVDKVVAADNKVFVARQKEKTEISRNEKLAANNFYQTQDLTLNQGFRAKRLPTYKKIKDKQPVSPFNFAEASFFGEK
jgi:hypothetical protein